MNFFVWLLVSIFFSLLVVQHSCVTPQAQTEDYNVDEETLALAAARDNNFFSLALYKQLRKKGQNHIMSPLSISTSLAMAYAGAAGDTASEFVEVLQFNDSKLFTHKGFGVLSERLNADMEKHGFSLKAANRLWPTLNSEAMKLKAEKPDDFVNVMQRFYKADVEPQDFVHKSEAARERINQWVYDRTGLTDVLPPGSVSSQTAMVLTNALYLRAEWRSVFGKSKPSDRQPFNSEGGSKNLANEKMAFMYLTENLRYAENTALGFQALEMPIKTTAEGGGRLLTMLLVLPATGKNLFDLENGLTTDILDDLDEKLSVANVALELPKFTHTQAFDLGDALQNLGLKKAFQKDAADFSEMASYPPEKRLFISKILHKAFIDVNENGLEASAATATEMVQVTGMMPGLAAPIPFRANRPFLFLIREDKTKAILFIGRLATP